MNSLVCVGCGLPVEPHTSYIDGKVVPDGIAFKWACEHHPAEDAEIILGSTTCAATWVNEHPEYEPVIDKLLATHEC